MQEGLAGACLGEWTDGSLARERRVLTCKATSHPSVPFTSSTTKGKNHTATMKFTPNSSNNPSAMPADHSSISAGANVYNLAVQNPISAESNPSPSPLATTVDTVFKESTLERPAVCNSDRYIVM